MNQIRNVLLAAMLSLTAGCATGSAPIDGEENAALDEAGLGAEDTLPISCGGLLGIGCPEKYECLDDWRDECDPTQGGADCPGLCEHKDGGAACSVSGPLCAAGEVCVFGPFPAPCAPPADDVPPQCFDGTCVAADCSPSTSDDIAGIDCGYLVRCAPGYVVHADACGCSCVPACDPSMLCGDALTCVDGDLYPTTCGPANCDQPIGACKPLP